MWGLSVLARWAANGAQSSKGGLSGRPLQPYCEPRCSTCDVEILLAARPGILTELKMALREELKEGRAPWRPV